MEGDELDTELVIQQLSSPGQKAFVSTSSQNKASSPLTHSPWQGLTLAGILVAIALIGGVDVGDVVEVAEVLAAVVECVDTIGMK